MLWLLFESASNISCLENAFHMKPPALAQTPDIYARVYYIINYIYWGPYEKAVSNNLLLNAIVQIKHRAISNKSHIPAMIKVKFQIMLQL